MLILYYNLKNDDLKKNIVEYIRLVIQSYHHYLYLMKSSLQRTKKPNINKQTNASFFNSLV